MLPSYWPEASLEGIFLTKIHVLELIVGCVIPREVVLAYIQKNIN